MGQSATTRENAAKREEVLKKKLQQVNKQLLEAESRAAYMEEERNKLEVLTNQMNEEKDILRKMKEKKCAEHTQYSVNGLFTYPAKYYSTIKFEYIMTNFLAQMALLFMQ